MARPKKEITNEEEIFNVESEVVDDLSNDIDEGLLVDTKTEENIVPSETKVFGESVIDNMRDEPETISVPKADFERLLTRINDLEDITGKASEPLSLLKETKKGKKVRVSFFTDPESMDAQMYMLYGVISHTLPNGSVVETYKKLAKDIDGQNKVKDFIKVQLIDLETGDISVKEIMKDLLSSYMTQKYYDVIDERSKEVNLTPADETVYRTEYKESGSYVRQSVGNEEVKIEARGNVTFYSVEVNGKKYELPHSVINFN